MQKIKNILMSLYDKADAIKAYKHLCPLLDKTKVILKKKIQNYKGGFALDYRDVILITYGDQFRREQEMPLKTLYFFLKKYVYNKISAVHILPFFPYSSDDGFSVIDYRHVNPQWGQWSDINNISCDFKLMCDLVINHISAQSLWFQEFLKGSKKYKDFFITVPAGTDTSGVARPRALPLLNNFVTKQGEKLVWTTFSRDQIDLNFKNYKVLLEMIDVLLTYVKQGAAIIRLDAIAYLWKEPGTSCIHLKQVYLVVQLMRAVLEIVAPWVIIITETNVPHKENISYFGDGSNQAHMVYQFSLPPLMLHAFYKSNAFYLNSWAQVLANPPGLTTFFNFLASHDGIGLLPAHGIIPQTEIEELVAHVKAQDGLVSYKDTKKGKIPYELNISYLDAITKKSDTVALKAKKFLAAQAIMLSFIGVPAIYIHSLLGSRNYVKGVKDTGSNRAINREKFNMAQIEAELQEKNNLRSLVYRGYILLLKARCSEQAFDPLGEQSVINVKSAPSLCVVQRRAAQGESVILCVHNISENTVELKMSKKQVSFFKGSDIKDIITERRFENSEIWCNNFFRLKLAPYEVFWLKSI